MIDFQKLYDELEPLSEEEARMLFPNVTRPPTGHQIVGYDIDLLFAVSDDQHLYVFAKYKTHPRYIYQAFEWDGQMWRVIEAFDDEPPDRPLGWQDAQID